MKRLLNLIHNEVADFKENGVIYYFFEDYEEYLAYRPFIMLIGILGAITLFVSLLSF